MPVAQNEMTASRIAYPRRVDPRRWPRTLCVLLALVVSLFVAAPARAASEDAAVQGQVKDVLDNDYANGNFGPAKSKLEGLLGKCKKGCNGATKAQIYVALGMVASQVGQADDARNDFA